MITPEMACPRRNPAPSMIFQIASRDPRWCTKNKSETVAVTSVSTGAEARPWIILIADREAKVVAAKPQIHVASRTAIEMTKKGRLPHTVAPDAVRKVIRPVQNASRPIMLLEAVSKLTWYLSARMLRPGVSMETRDAVTAELKDRISMILNFHFGAQLRGSLGELLGCGCKMISPSFFSLLESTFATAGTVSPGFLWT